MSVPHDKVRSLRLTGGRLSGEHQRGTKTVVVASGVACPECGSTLVRVSAEGDECEGCRRNKRREEEQARKMRAAREAFRNDAMRSRLRKPINQYLEITRSLNHHRVSLSSNSGASPAVKQIIINKINRCEQRIEVLESVLQARFSAGLTPHTQPNRNNEIKERRKILSDISMGRRKISETLGDPSLDGILSRTHAFAILRARHGHVATARAFQQANTQLAIPCTKEWHITVLSIHESLSKTSKPLIYLRKHPTPQEMQQRRTIDQERLLERLKSGEISLLRAIESKSLLRKLSRCKTHEIIDQLAKSKTQANEIKGKIGGTKERKIGDLSNLELIRLIRLIEPPEGRDDRQH